MEPRPSRRFFVLHFGAWRVLGFPLFVRVCVCVLVVGVLMCLFV